MKQLSAAAKKVLAEIAANGSVSYQSDTQRRLYSAARTLARHGILSESGFQDGTHCIQQSRVFGRQGGSRGGYWCIRTFKLKSIA